MSRVVLECPTCGALVNDGEVELRDPCPKCEQSLLSYGPRPESPFPRFDQADMAGYFLG
jgi:predicted  nucleic acid-binding Zn-ribbon protein